MPKTKDEKITVEAELTVNGETVRTHCRAWVVALDKPRPVTVTFQRFVRKEEK